MVVTARWRVLQFSTCTGGMDGVTQGVVIEMAAADDGTDWSLFNFARRVLGAKSAAREVGFNFVEPEPQKADLEPPKVEREPPRPDPLKPETAATPAATEPA